MKIYIARDKDIAYKDNYNFFVKEPKDFDGVWIGNIFSFCRDIASFKKNFGIFLKPGELVEAELRIDLLPQKAEKTRKAGKEVKK